MAMRYLAKLGASLDLPEQFSYEPYVPTPRITVQQTYGAVVIQRASTLLVHGEGTIPFEIPKAYPSEWKDLYALYDGGAAELAFLGYWGEELTVRFTTLDRPKVRGRLFDISGQLLVVAVTTLYTGAGCGLIPSP